MLMIAGVTGTAGSSDGWFCPLRPPKKLPTPAVTSLRAERVLRATRAAQSARVRASRPPRACRAGSAAVRAGGRPPCLAGVRRPTGDATDDASEPSMFGCVSPHRLAFPCEIRALGSARRLEKSGVVLLQAEACRSGRVRLLFRSRCHQPETGSRVVGEEVIRPAQPLAHPPRDCHRRHRTALLRCQFSLFFDSLYLWLQKRTLRRRKPADSSCASTMRQFVRSQPRPSPCSHDDKSGARPR